MILSRIINDFQKKRPEHLFAKNRSIVGALVIFSLILICLFFCFSGWLSFKLELNRAQYFMSQAAPDYLFSQSGIENSLSSSPDNMVESDFLILADRFIKEGLFHSLLLKTNENEVIYEYPHNISYDNHFTAINILFAASVTDDFMADTVRKKTIGKLLIRPNYNSYLIDYFWGIFLCITLIFSFFGYLKFVYQSLLSVANEKVCQSEERESRYQKKFEVILSWLVSRELRTLQISEMILASQKLALGIVNSDSKISNNRIISGCISDSIQVIEQQVRLSNDTLPEVCLSLKEYQLYLLQRQRGIEIIINTKSDGLTLNPIQVQVINLYIDDIKKYNFEIFSMKIDYKNGRLYFDFFAADNNISEVSFSDSNLTGRLEALTNVLDIKIIMTTSLIQLSMPVIHNQNILSEKSSNKIHYLATFGLSQATYFSLKLFKIQVEISPYKAIEQLTNLNKFDAYLISENVFSEKLVQHICVNGGDLSKVILLISHKSLESQDTYHYWDMGIRKIVLEPLGMKQIIEIESILHQSQPDLFEFEI